MICTNLFSLLLFSPSSGTNLGSCNPPPKCAKWEAHCERCSKLRTWTRARDILRKFWVKCHRLRTMPPENVVPQMLYFQKRT
jgi:hypothetical protein